MATKERIAELRAKALRVSEEFDKFVIGQTMVGKLMISSAIQGGICHFLAEGVPGTAKTRSVEVFTRLVGNAQMAYIPFTSDMMPKDITGSAIYTKETNPDGTVVGKWVPMFGEIADANIVMGDEINRGATHTQSALLGPMSDGRVKLPASSLPPEQSMRQMPKMNVFLCTQNPLDQEGTNPLPEAQHDRFLYNVKFNYPSREAELHLMRNPHLARRSILDTIKPVITVEEILELREYVLSNIKISDSYIEYAGTVVRATRPGSPEFVALWKKNPEIRPILEAIKSGISPRANIAFLEACMIRAFLFGTNEDGVSSRDFVMPEDLKALCHAVYRHRLTMKDEAALRVVKGASSEDMFSDDEFPSDGSITREQVVERLKRPGRNPILVEHAIDAILTHLDHTTDWSKYQA